MQHSIDGEKAAHLVAATHLPVPAAGQEHGLIARFEEPTARLDQFVRRITAFVVGAERITDELGRFVDGAQRRAEGETGHIVAAQQSLVVLLRRLLHRHQRQEVDIAASLAS